MGLQLRRVTLLLTTQRWPIAEIITCTSLHSDDFMYCFTNLTRSQITQTLDSLALIQQNVTICSSTKTLKLSAWGQAARSRDCWLQLCVNADSYCSDPTPLKKGKWKKNELTYTPKRKFKGKETAKVQIYTECRGEMDGVVLVDDVEIIKMK